MEEIKQVRHKNGKKEFFVKWKGYGEKDCTWEPVENLAACSKMIKDFEKRQGKDEAPTANRKKRIESDDEEEPAEEKDNYEGKARFTILKRSLIDGEYVFKVKDKKAKKETFMSREETGRRRARMAPKTRTCIYDSLKTSLYLILV